MMLSASTSKRIQHILVASQLIYRTCLINTDLLLAGIAIAVLLGFVGHALATCHLFQVNVLLFAHLVLCLKLVNQLVIVALVVRLRISRVLCAV